MVFIKIAEIREKIRKPDEILSMNMNHENEEAVRPEDTNEQNRK
jgi:hypothetical protein